jgi:hypothetical protein
MSGFGRFVVKVLVVTVLIFVMLSIYGIFSFNYGFASSNAPKDYELLTITQIKMWKILGSQDEYAFVAITDTGKAYLGSGTTQEIGTLTGILYVTNSAKYAEISVAWWFVFPIVSFVILLIPGPHKSEPSTSSVSSSSTGGEQHVAVPLVPPKPLTPEEKEALAHHKRKSALIGGIISSTLVTALAITVTVLVINHNNEIEANREKTADGAALNPEGRHAFSLGSATAPITDPSVLKKAIDSHTVLDVHYKFTGSPNLSLSLPDDLLDVVFYNEGSSSNSCQFYLQVASGRLSPLTIGLQNVSLIDTLLYTEQNFSMNLKFAGTNLLHDTCSYYESSTRNHLIYAPNVDLTLTAAAASSQIWFVSEDGAAGTAGTNGKNPTTAEGECNGTNGTPGMGTGGGIYAKSLAISDAAKNSFVRVNTGDGGRGGNGGKRGWYFGVLGIGSHEGVDGTPGYGGTAGHAADIKDNKVTINSVNYALDSRGSLSQGNYTFYTGNDGARGSVNS